jgi:hypothetical protein
MTPSIRRGAGRGFALRSALVVTGALFLVLLAHSSEASAKVTWKSIGPVRMGMSEAQLRDRVGPPATVSYQGSMDVGPRTEPVYNFSYPRRKLVVVVSQKRVRTVRTTSRAHRTPLGVRVGTRTREMRRRLRNENCGRAEGRLVCDVLRGNSNIGFVSYGGRVREIYVGRL